MFTRTNVVKIMTLKEAKKETQKTKKEVQEKPQEPIALCIKLDSDMRVLEELYRVVRQNPGNRELKLTIVSKLQNVLIDSAIRVSSKLLEALDGNEFVDIVAS